MEKYNKKNKEKIQDEVCLEKGINEEMVKKISKYKKEPSWVLEKRLKCLKIFKELELPKWGPELKKLDLNKICYFKTRRKNKNSKKWEEVPEKIRKTFEKLGIPEAERKVLAGVGAQYDSEVVYHNTKKKLKKIGVIFEDFDEAIKRYPEILKKYFMTKCISPNLHKFAALHGAVFSGGTFIYIPKGVKIKMPLQAYFRMNAESFGQFEHTLIVADEGSECHYIEGCSAPKYNSFSLHAGGVEIFVHKNARVRYSSIENWSINTFNLNTKRAIVEENGIIEWVSGNLGSGVTMLYPASILIGENAKADYLTIAFASKNQNQDTGVKVYHLAKNTYSNVISKSISKNGGITSYRGFIKIAKGAKNARCSVNCDALMFDEESQSNTYPYIEVEEKDSIIVHEARTGKISEEKIFYLMSRGLTEKQALQLIVSGFIEPIIKELPLEYAIEMNKLINLEIEGNLG